MPVDVRIDEITLQVEALEAISPDDAASYPYGRLAQTGRVIDHTFESVVIANEFLTVTIVPALGGRVVRVEARDGHDFLPRYASPMVRPGSRRGVTVDHGIELLLDGERRLTALGPCLAQLDPARDDDEAGGVWLAQPATGTGLSFHLRYSLAPGVASLRVEARVQNRTWQPVAYNGGLGIEGALGQWGWESAELAFGEESRLARFGSLRELQPRQVDSWAVQLTPYRDLGAAAVRNAEAAIDLVDGEVRLQVSRQRLGHRLAIFTDDGRTLESPVDLYPEHRLELSLGDLVVAQVALLSPDREVVLTSAPSELPEELDTFSAGVRHAAYAQRGMAALRESRFEAAAEEFERSLLYNGDDPLCWWGQAFARRLAGGETEGDPSLANAHYLAPLEPVLRAEALLSQGVIEGAGPNPLLAPLAVAPEAFLVAANLLLETGQYTEATRFIDEALRHVDVPMLRYLLADALLSQTRMAAEAARQVGLAGRLGFGPPYPFGAAEFAALERLRARFPNDGVLAQFAALAKFGG